MSLIVFIAVVTTFWLIVHVINKANPTALSRRGFALGKGQLSYEFAKIPGWVNSFCSGWRKPLVRMWFDSGIVVALLLLPISVLVLLYNLFSTIAPSSSSQPVVSMTLMIPGVNISFSQLLHVLLALGVNGVIHEIGHTVAAAIEGIVPKAFGVFMFIIYPGAYVDMGHGVQNLPPRSRMRVYTAGVCQNVSIVIAALALLIVLPYIISPLFFVTGEGAVVVGIYHRSPLSGPGGLAIGDRLTAVDGCSVSGIGDYYQCIDKLLKHITEIGKDGAGKVGYLGHCLDPKSMEAHGVMWKQAQCCANQTMFYDLRCLLKSDGVMFRQDLGCMPEYVEKFGPPKCRSDGDCASEEVCYHRVVPPSPTNSLISITRNSGASDAILFYGPPLVLLETLTLSDYWPRYLAVSVSDSDSQKTKTGTITKSEVDDSGIDSTINIDTESESEKGKGTLLASFLVQIPTTIETFLRFLVSVSAAVALLNVLPIPKMDGEFICRTVIEKVFHSALQSRILSATLIFGSTLLGLNIIVWIISLF